MMLCNAIHYSIESHITRCRPPLLRSHSEIHLKRKANMTFIPLNENAQAFTHLSHPTFLGKNYILVWVHGVLNDIWPTFDTRMDHSTSFGCGGWNLQPFQGQPPMCYILLVIMHHRVIDFLLIARFFHHFSFSGYHVSIVGIDGSWLLEDRDR